MKYMGSKSRIKKYIVPILQNIIDNNKITTYIEPFCGGCNIIDSIKCKHRFANDISTPLIEMWKGLVNGELPPKELSKEHYDDVKNSFRNNDNKYPMFYVGMIGFLGSYNAKFFDGGYAKTIISKTGVLRNYYAESCKNILKQLPQVKDIIFSNKSYKDMNNNIKNCLIYCDIPYFNTTGYETSKDFNHDEFWHWVKETSKNNVVVVSELIAPKDFIAIWEQPVTRTLDNKSRSMSIEKLFVYKDIYNKYFK